MAIFLSLFFCSEIYRISERRSDGYPEQREQGIGSGGKEICAANATQQSEREKERERERERERVKEGGSKRHGREKRARW